jgi:hypothetical protein
MSIDTAVDRYADFFRNFSPSDLDRFHDFFAENAHFRDPFNDVYGVAAIRKVFAHMYQQCAQPRFEVNDYAISGQVAYLHWRFNCDEGLVIDGLSKVVFDERGMVLEHLDYWDAVAQVYQRIPLLGSILRIIRRKLAA